MIFSLQGLGPAVLFWIYFNKPELLWGPSPRQRSGVQRGQVGSLDWDMMCIYISLSLSCFASYTFYYTIYIYIHIYVKWLLVGFKTMLVDVVSMVSIHLMMIPADPAGLSPHRWAPHRWDLGHRCDFSKRLRGRAATLGQAGSWGLGALGPWGLGALGAAFANRYSGCFRLVSMAQDGDFLRSMERKSKSRHWSDE